MIWIVMYKSDNSNNSRHENMRGLHKILFFIACVNISRDIIFLLKNSIHRQEIFHFKIKPFRGSLSHFIR